MMYGFLSQYSHLAIAAFEQPTYYQLKNAYPNLSWLFYKCYSSFKITAWERMS